MSHAPVVAAAPEEAVRLARAAAGSGYPLPDRLREHLERSLDARLDHLRLHVGWRANRITQVLDADAVTTGADVFLGDAMAPMSVRGVRLIAHEAVHVLQQRGLAQHGAGAVILTDPGAEEAAEAFATHPERRPTAPIQGGRGGQVAPQIFQRHSSWEHRLLGDAHPTDLDAIANAGPQRTQLVTQIIDFLYMWHADPDSVTEQMIAAYYPHIRTTRLTMSNLLVTYGELNTLPDYVADPGAIDQLPREILLPILQAVRQEGYNRARQLLGSVPFPTNFAGAVAINIGWSFLDLLLETRAVDNLTWDLGPNHTNHYTAIVARNACHFAPYSWYRWLHAYNVARQSALRAYGATDPVQKNISTHEAWVNLGYADHFLQDSFAAGHLVNKTLIMQWFVEWAAEKRHIPVADWDAVKNVTAARQPNVAAPQLYDMANPGTTFDPQTAEEQPTLALRTAMSGVQADGPISQQQAYENWLAFLNSTVTQSSSGALHDYFNQNSLLVDAAAIARPFQIWGDDTMLRGGAGVSIACQTAYLSKQSIADLIATGSTQFTPEMIMACFPTVVVDPTSGQRQNLQQWQYSQPVKDLAFSIFPKLHYYLLRGFPRIGYVSVDAPQIVSSAAVDLRGTVAAASSLPAH